MDDARDTRQRLTHWNHILRQACARSRNDKRRFDDTRRRESHGRRSIHCRTVYEHTIVHPRSVLNVLWKKEKREKGEREGKEKKEERWSSKREWWKREKIKTVFTYVSSTWTAAGLLTNVDERERVEERGGCSLVEARSWENEERQPCRGCQRLKLLPSSGFSNNRR